MSEFIETAEIKDAWDRVARTADGQIIFRHLNKLAMALAADLSALPVHEGGRILARNLMSLMSQGIADNDRYCVAFVTRAPEPVERPRGAGRRIGPEHFVPGYDVDRTGTTYDGSTGNGAGGTGST
jgi:hypothetical protein